MHIYVHTFTMYMYMYTMIKTSVIFVTSSDCCCSTSPLIWGSMSIAEFLAVNRGFMVYFSCMYMYSVYMLGAPVLHLYYGNR